jgi:hypothetical protein
MFAWKPIRVRLLGSGGFRFDEPARVVIDAAVLFWGGLGCYLAQAVQ